MAVKKICTFDDPILRQKSEPVEKIDFHIKKILHDMTDTMRHAPNGGGLSAVQIGILLRLVVIDVGDGLIRLVNPVIVEKSGKRLVEEGCLSFPDVWGKVWRPERVTVKALNQKGEEITIRAEGLLAQCLCHEIDHLDGIVFTDKVVMYVKD